MKTRYILTIQVVKEDEIKIHHIEYKKSTLNGFHKTALDILLENIEEE